MRRRAAPALAGVLVASCATAHGILDQRGRGETRCYHAPFDDLWTAAERALAVTGLVLERANREEGVFVARSYEPEVKDPQDMAVESDAGERVAMFFQRDGDDVWAVEVVSRPIFALDVTARDWTRPVFLALEDALPGQALDPGDALSACVRARTGPPPAPPPAPAPDPADR